MKSYKKIRHNHANNRLIEYIKNQEVPPTNSIFADSKTTIGKPTHAEVTIFLNASA